jgi:ATP-binding cassette subfamily B protein
MKNISKNLRERPKYSMWQNSIYMMKEAWTVHKSVVFLCIALAAINVATSLTELFITPIILQKIEAKVSLTDLFTTIIPLISTLLVLSGLKAYIDTNSVFGRVAVRMSLINKVTQKTATTSFPNTEDTVILMKLEKAERALSSNNEASEAIWNTLGDLLKSITGFIIYLFLLSSLNVFLISIVLITSIINFFVRKSNREWSFRHRDEESSYSKKITYICKKAENSSLAKDVRLFGMRPWFEDVYNSTLNLYEDFIARREKLFILADFAEVLMTLLRNGIAYFYLITMIINSEISASQFLLYFTAISGFTAWINEILTNISTLHTQNLDLNGIREYVETPEIFNFDSGKTLKRSSSNTYKIELCNLSFRYPNANKNTIEKMNLTIEAGEKLAIVGLNGAGKTTLVKLICGFLDPTEGEVLLNGINIKEYNRNDYYKLFSAVFQQFSVLEVTLIKNIAQTDMDIDLQRIDDCIEKAGLTNKIKSLPNQYQTYIGHRVFEEGIELSGGEMQRLMLARALYKGGPIIVLDEPTAALDPIAENNIYMKYNEMTADSTSIFISHRLASTRFCDRIILIADGKIAEEGTHEMLVGINGIYAELFYIQSKYYKEGSDFDEEQKS